VARMKFKAGDDYALKLSRLATGSDEIAKKAIYAAADIVTDRIRSEMDKKLSGESTGDMAASLGIAPIKRDSDSNWNTKIGFDGYDRNGVPNQLKARVLESGSSKQPKRPFVRPAVNATKKQAQAKMGEVIDEEIKKLMGGK
jgi:HK97 gp10 family phage protein